MQQSETNTLAAALTTMMAGASALSTLANTDIIEVRNSAGALKGKITAAALAAFAAGSAMPYLRVHSLSWTQTEVQSSFQSWFQSIPARTVHLAYCQKPQGSLLFGFKVSNDYGGFAQVGYDGIPKKFCSITKGQYDFSTT